MTCTEFRNSLQICNYTIEDVFFKGTKFEAKCRYYYFVNVTQRAAFPGRPESRVGQKPANEWFGREGKDNGKVAATRFCAPAPLTDVTEHDRRL